jgi:hypothetical protein
MAGARSFNVALSSPHVYLAGPVIAEGKVRAAFALPPEPGDDTHRQEFGVALGLEGGNGLVPECSRCQQVFGWCPHVTLLALDLAISPELRRAVFSFEAAGEHAAKAPERRALVVAERQFEKAMAAWTVPSADAAPIQLAATPFYDEHGFSGGYRPHDELETVVVGVTARLAGERKLLNPPELASARFPSRDRRVLELTRNRGSGRKVVYAVDVEASLIVEAMRTHGGVYSHNFKAPLAFRASALRPVLALAEGNRDRALETLVALWSTEDEQTRVPVSDAVFIHGPFPFVWTRAGTIHPVASDVDPDFVRQLVRTPRLRLPQTKLREAGSRLLRSARGRGVVLPAHEAFGLPPVETPRMLLRMVGEPLDVEGELVAIYRAGEIPLVAPDALLPRGDASDELRDYEHEARGRAHVERVGLLAPPSTTPRPLASDAAGAGAERPRRPFILLGGEDAVAFWQRGLLTLRDATDPPVDVHLSEQLAQIRLGMPIKVRIRISLEGDWLHAKLEFRSDELPVELELIRAALARKQRWVTLSDGTLARISAEIASLSDEAKAIMAEASQAKLPPHQLGRLARWVDENDGEVDVAVDGLRRRLRALAVTPEPDMPKGLKATLRPYQKAGVAWLQFLQALGAGGILADDMGLGKTLMTLAFLLRRKQLEGAAPNLVVCPTSVATNWVREAERFTPGLRVLLLHGPARHLTAITKHDVVVTTYALLRRDIERLEKTHFRCAVLDEAQNIKNADNATTRAANRLDASMRLALSGTPVENRLGELWSLSSFVNPGILGSVRGFETRYERPIAADHKSPIAAELRAVVRPFLLRRTKDDVLPDLPPKIEVDRVVTLTAADKRMYDALAHTLRSSVERDIEARGLAASSMSVFTALTRLRQMCCDPRLIDLSLASPKTSKSPYRDAGGDDTAPSAKRGAFLDLVRELVAEGRRALVFSQFVQLLTLWRLDLDADKIAYEYLDGGTGNRQEIVDRFQNGRAPLFLISLKAGGVGLNLTAADTVIHCDPWWNPAVEDQATDRAHRIGQSKTVTVVRLIAGGTIEEKIRAMKQKKRALSKAIVGDDAGALEGLTEKDVRMLLGDAAQESAFDDGEAGEVAPVNHADDTLATATEILSPAFGALVIETKKFLTVTGMPKARLAALVDIPTEFAQRLARGEPFPCSRVVADRIRAKLRDY